MQISNHFRIEELVPKGIFDAFGVQSTIFIEPRLVTLLEAIHGHFGKEITVNDWLWGGTYYDSGYRPPDTPTGAKYSQHRFGRAADLKIEGLEAHEVYLEILNNEIMFRLAGLSAMENILSTPTWIHIDVRNIPFSNRILIVNP